MADENCQVKLFLEGYYLDRLLMHTQDAGLLRDVVAIIFGNFGIDVSKVLRAFAAQNNVPVFRSNSFGLEGNNLPFGYECSATTHQLTENNFQIEMDVR